jgi:hypothetical protein
MAITNRDEPVPLRDDDLNLERKAGVPAKAAQSKPNPGKHTCKTPLSTMDRQIHQHYSTM